MKKNSLKIKIQKATIDDVDLMVKINSESGYRWKGNPKKVKGYILEDFKEKNPNNFFPFIVELDKRTIAYFILSTKDKECYIDFLSVSKTHQNKGIGSTIIKKSVHIAKKEHCNKMLLRVWSKNYPAIALYNKFGFYVKDIQKKYFKNGDDKLIMEKNL